MRAQYSLRTKNSLQFMWLFRKRVLKLYHLQFHESKSKPLCQKLSLCQRRHSFLRRGTLQIHLIKLLLTIKGPTYHKRLFIRRSTHPPLRLNTPTQPRRQYKIPHTKRPPQPRIKQYTTQTSRSSHQKIHTMYQQLPTSRLQQFRFKGQGYTHHIPTQHQITKNMQNHAQSQQDKLRLS